MRNFLSCCFVCDPVNSDVKNGFPHTKSVFVATSGAFAQLQPFPSVTSKDGFEAPLLVREGEEARVRREEAEEEESRESWGAGGCT